MSIQLLDAQGREQKCEPEPHSIAEMTTPDNVGPHIAKIPLRAEYRDLLRASELYAEQAAKHQGEADRLQTLSQQALEQAENLKKQANL